VLHDMFGMPFEEIAPIIRRSPTAARQLASRARRRVRGAQPSSPPPTTAEQRAVIDAFLAASREGNFDALIDVLDPSVVMRIDQGPAGLQAEVRGAAEVAGMVLAQGTPRAPLGRPATVNGAPGVVVANRHRVIAVAAFTIAAGRIISVNIIADPEKLHYAHA
jgi:hypothetical protein